MTLSGYGAPVPVWMVGTALEDVFLNDPDFGWIATGDPNLAMEGVRRSTAYDQILPGNRRDDGTLRFDEGTYYGMMESYEDILLSVDVNPDLFRSKFVELMEGEVSPNELATRVNSMYDRVITQSQQIKDFYAANYAFDMSDSAIVASFLDPDVGQAILDRRLSVAEVGGSAAERQFTIGADLAERLVNYGVDTRGEAQGYFAEAETMLPVLDTLAKRHADPDDDFDLNEFTTATIFGDPEARRRMRRLMAQERSSFGVDTSLAVRRNEAGSLTGLEAQ